MANAINMHPGNFFYRLPHLDKQELLSIGSKRLMPKDQRIFQAGNDSDDIYIVLEGRVKVSEISPEGKEVILWFCFAGELIGISEMVSGGSREMNALTCCPCVVLSIKQSEFEQYLQRRPAAAKGVIDVLTGRLRDLSDAFLILTTGDVYSRVSRLLGRLCLRYGTRDKQGLRIDLPLTHQEMADMIGSSRQSVTTVLGQLKREGRIRIAQRTICVEDLEWIDQVLETPWREFGQGNSSSSPYTQVIPLQS